jgi:hypothetical protein
MLTVNLKNSFSSRYLENSGCVGMCVNMCKIPTQDFFTNEFGLPLTMIPSKSLFMLSNCDLCTISIEALVNLKQTSNSVS